MASMPEKPPTSNNTTPQRPTSKPFRFKKHHQRTPSPSAAYRQRSASPSTSYRSSRRSHHHHYHQHHRHHHRSRRRPHTPIDDPTLYDDTYLPNSKSEQYLDPDIAFRESLFDALADDEGALYWEGVYGQPIHTYPRYREANNDDDDDIDPENPKLEMMTDEEYVSYVRGKMWEKSHQHILEERRKREAQRKRDKEAGERNRQWQTSFDEGMRRVEERRKKERWQGVWKEYGRKWDRTFNDGAKGSIKERISWPVESGKWQDVGKEEVETFFRHGAGVEGVDLGEVLKRERVRWHPDKMQQRAGSEGIDNETMKAVTAVFQVVDRLWGETRGKA